jgi:two-component system heavy metal sensor histidine kinase CusS
MKSIKARLTLLYALSATVTLACLFVVGYLLLHNYLIAGLDFLNAAEFEQIKANLGPEFKSLDPVEINTRIRDASDRSSIRYYISVHITHSNVLFYSSNLNGLEIPDVANEKTYNVHIDKVGDLRVGEFVLGPLEILVATPLDQVAAVMGGYVRVSFALLVLMLIISIFVGIGVSQVMLHPIRLISQTAAGIGSDNLSARVPVSAVRDEISDLARLLNLMFERIEHAFEQVRRFAAEASHELKTPLSLVRLHAERLLSRGNLAPDQEEAVLVQMDELNRLNRIIDELLLLSRAEAQAVRMDIAPRLIDKFLETFAQDALVLTEDRKLQFSWWHQGAAEFAFDERWIRQVLLNLLANAMAVSPSNSAIVLQSTSDGQQWRVEMIDQGPGLSADQRARMFDRFVRFGPDTSQDRGSGLGLAICRSIVELHRGQIFAAAGTGGAGLKVGFALSSAASNFSARAP